MAGRTGQAFAWPVPLVPGLLPPCGPPPYCVATIGGGSLIEPRSIRKMRYLLFTQELRLGLLVLMPISVLEVRHG